MKRVPKYLFIAALSMVLLFAGCSISMGFPWLAGGWGGIIDFGFTSSVRSSSENFTMDMVQEGSGLKGTISLNGSQYEFTGSVNRQGVICMEFTIGNENIMLNGSYENGILAGSNNSWSAHRLENN